MNRLLVYIAKQLLYWSHQHSPLINPLTKLMREVMLIFHFIGLTMGLGTGFAHAFLGAAVTKDVGG